MTDTNEDPERWKHRKGDNYYAVRSYPQGTPEHCEWSHWWDSDALPTLAAAKRAGFAAAESDDFNILAERDGRIVAMLWMDEVIDDGVETLDEWEASR